MGRPRDGGLEQCECDFYPNTLKVKRTPARGLDILSPLPILDSTLTWQNQNQEGPNHGEETNKSRTLCPRCSRCPLW